MARAPQLCPFLALERKLSPLQPQAILSMKQDKFTPEAAGVVGQSSASQVVLGSNPGCPALALVFCGNTGHGLLGLQARGCVRIWEHRLGGTLTESTPSFSPLCSSLSLSVLQWRGVVGMCCESGRVKC